MVASQGATRRAFAVDDLPRIIAEATCVDVSALYAAGLGPLDQLH